MWTISLFGKTKKMQRNRELSSLPGDSTQEVIEYVKKRMLPPIVYYENFLFNFPDSIYLEMKDENEKEQGYEIYAQVIQDVLNSMGRGLNVEKHLLNRYKAKKPNERSSMASVLS